MVTTQKKMRPAQTQPKPGIQKDMHPQPLVEKATPQTNRLKNKVLLITGGDSGIGKAVSILFAKEGADVAVVFLSESEDANDTKQTIEEYNRKCLLLEGDISKEGFCKQAVEKTIETFGKIDILINNAAVQYESKSLEEMDIDNMIKTFEVNIFSMFYITKAALPYLKKGACIINTSSVTAYRGSDHLIDYAATKGAIVAFTRSLASNLVKKGIRVNGVAPGPIWTPLIVSSFDKEKVSEHGKDVPMERSGEPIEVAPCYLFLATDDSSYMTGQFLHPNGGEIING